MSTKDTPTVKNITEKKRGKKMVFKSINGLVESQDFTDFWRWCATHFDKLRCPACDKKAKISHFFTGLMGMHLTGYATFRCIDPDCEFNKTNFTIQAIPRSEQKW